MIDDKGNDTGVNFELTDSIYTQSMSLTMLLLKLCISGINIKPKWEGIASCWNILSLIFYDDKTDWESLMHIQVPISFSMCSSYIKKIKHIFLWQIGYKSLKNRFKLTFIIYREFPKFE